MLKLELVRFAYYEVATIGVMYGRDGWMCYTLENVTRDAEVYVPNFTALAEGLYSAAMVRDDDWHKCGVTISEDGVHPLRRFCNCERAYQLNGDIGVGYSANLQTGEVKDNGDALTSLIAMVQSSAEAFISIRHLDGLLLNHLTRMHTAARK